ncbi:hypothetical protein ScPMuIL_014132 [Solemya velum]
MHRCSIAEPLDDPKDVLWQWFSPEGHARLTGWVDDEVSPSCLHHRRPIIWKRLTRITIHFLFVRMGVPGDLLEAYLCTHATSGWSGVRYSSPENSITEGKKTVVSFC